MKTPEQFVNEECAVYNAEALIAAVKARDAEVRGRLQIDLADARAAHEESRRGLDAIITEVRGDLQELVDLTKAYVSVVFELVPGVARDKVVVDAHNAVDAWLTEKGCWGPEARAKHAAESVKVCVCGLRRTDHFGAVNRDVCPMGGTFKIATPINLAAPKCPYFCDVESCAGEEPKVFPKAATSPALQPAPVATCDEWCQVSEHCHGIPAGSFSRAAAPQLSVPAEPRGTATCAICDVERPVDQVSYIGGPGAFGEYFCLDCRPACPS